MPEAVILYTTWPDPEMAEAAARSAIEAGLCACVNIGRPGVSLYRWEGEMQRDLEAPVLFKTTPERVEALKALILERHPYELPCVLALPVAAENSHPAYLAWIGQATAQR